MTVNSWAYGTVILLQTIFALMCSCNHISVTMVTRIPEQYNLRGLLEVTTRSKATESLIGSSRTNYFIMRYIIAYFAISAHHVTCKYRLQIMVCPCVTRTDGRSDWLAQWLQDGLLVYDWLTDVFGLLVIFVNILFILPFFAFRRLSLKYFQLRMLEKQRSKKMLRTSHGNFQSQLAFHL